MSGQQAEGAGARLPPREHAAERGVRFAVARLLVEVEDDVIARLLADRCPRGGGVRKEQTAVALLQPSQRVAGGRAGEVTWSAACSAWKPAFSCSMLLLNGGAEAGWGYEPEMLRYPSQPSPRPPRTLRRPPLCRLEPAHLSTALRVLTGTGCI